MQTGHELFVHGLNDILDGEHQLVEALEENANDSSRADLKKPRAKLSDYSSVWSFSENQAIKANVTVSVVWLPRRRLLWKNSRRTIC